MTPPGDSPASNPAIVPPEVAATTNASDSSWVSSKYSDAMSWDAAASFCRKYTR